MTTNPYTLAALVGLTSGEKHGNLSHVEIERLCARAKEIGETAAKVCGDRSWDADQTDAFPDDGSGASATPAGGAAAAPSGAAPTTPTGTAPAT